MIMISPIDPLVTALAGVTVGILLGVGGSLAAPHVVGAARSAGASVIRWRAARRATASRRVGAAKPAPAVLSAEVLAAIVAAVRAELGKTGPAVVAPVVAAPVAGGATAPEPTLAPPVRSADPWIVR